MQHITLPSAKALELPFSSAVRAGDYLFLSGAIGNRPGGFGADAVVRLRQSHGAPPNDAGPGIVLPLPTECLARVQRCRQIIIADGQVNFRRWFFF